MIRTTALRHPAGEADAARVPRGGLPLHHRLFLVLRDRLTNGAYPPGSQLPGEEELRREFGVSRVTVRSALGALAEAGLIERRHGAGTFAASAGALDETPGRGSLSELAAHMREVGRRTTPTLHEFGYGPSPAWLTALSPHPPGMLFQRAVRTRAAAGRPLLHVTTFVPEAIGRHWGPKEMARVPLADLLAAAGAETRAGEQAVGAALADPAVAERLALPIGAPLLRVRRAHLDARRAPVEYAEVLVSPETFELRSSLTPDEVAPR